MANMTRPPVEESEEIRGAAVRICWVWRHECMQIGASTSGQKEEETLFCYLEVDATLGFSSE